MKQEKMFKIPKTNVKVFVASVNEDVTNETVKIAQEFRERGISCQVDLMDRNVAKQLEFANNLGIPFAIVVGPREISKKKFKLKEMETGKEEELSLEKIIKKLTSRTQ
jgi:histidyl-tRNA synthetase